MAWGEKDNERQNAGRARVREIIVAAKRVPCADCGGTFRPCVMEFEHRGEKHVKIADWPRRVGYGLAAIAKLREEIAKCDVLCANCHRLRHADELEGEWRGERSAALPFVTRNRRRGRPPARV